MPATIIKRWNGSAWVEDYPKTTHTQIVAGGTPSGSTFLRGDGVWATVSSLIGAGSASGHVPVWNDTTGLWVSTAQSSLSVGYATNAGYATSAGSATDSTKLPLSGGSMSGLLIGRANASEGINVNTQGTPSFEVYSTNNAAAFITLHKAGHYAVRFGLDTDNNLKVGGWSMGNVAYTIWHTGNLSVASGSTSSGTANGQVKRWDDSSGSWVNIAQTSLVAGSVSTSVTFNNGGSGAASGTTYDGGTARTISYNTIGAAATNSTSTLAGGVKTRLSGTTLFITNNGNNA